MAADAVSAAGHRVTIYERMPTAGRKLLMAGRGGLNLTHSEPLSPFIARYGRAAERMRAPIESFDPQAARAWSETLGQQTFVGSSGRVFPKSMKASPLLRAWLQRLAERGIELKVRHRWLGWRDGQLVFSAPGGEVMAEADAVVLALGGASWPSLGTDGSWASLLREAGIDVATLRPSNCGFRVSWSDHFKQRFEGHPLKRIALTHADVTARGEVVLTSSGIEGGAVYAISAALRDDLERAGHAQVTLDLRPDIPEQALAALLARPRGKQSMSQFLRKAAKLSAEAIGLLQENAHAAQTSLGTLTAGELAALIKGLRLSIEATAPIDKAISSAGGISWQELDSHFMLLKRPGIFAAGEMLDWEAPTGGYLLQGCLATGAAAGHGAVAWLVQRHAVS